MTEKDRNALIRLPSGAIAKAGSGPERILSGMVSDALAVALKRFRIGNYEFRAPDYRQILLWAEALRLEPAVIVQRLSDGSYYFGDYIDDSGATVKFVVEDGAIVTMTWDFNLLPITDFEWVGGLAIRDIAFYGTATARLSLPLPLLNRLFCFGINIDELDLSNVPALRYLLCDCNPLTKLDLSNVPALTGLWCGDNGLSELDLSSTPALTGLFCGANRLTKLDLSNVPTLVELCCDSNQLAELDLSKVPALTVLVCGRNRLTELDIRLQRKLSYLHHDPSVTLIKLTTQNPEK